MSTDQSFYENKKNNPNQVVVTKLQGGFPVNAPLATQPQTIMSVQNNGVHQGGFAGNTSQNQQTNNNIVQSLGPQIPSQENNRAWEDYEQNGGDFSDDDEDDDDDDDDEDENENEDQDECDEEDCEQSGGASDVDTASTVSTTKLFGRDPLYLVLSSFLSNEEGENIVDVLSKINRNLAKLVAVLDKDKDNKSSKKNKGDDKRKSKN